MDGQGLVYILDLTGRALAEANARIVQLEQQITVMQSNAASEPPADATPVDR